MKIICDSNNNSEDSIEKGFLHVDFVFDSTDVYRLLLKKQHAEELKTVVNLGIDCKIMNEWCELDRN